MVDFICQLDESVVCSSLVSTSLDSIEEGIQPQDSSVETLPEFLTCLTFSLAWPALRISTEDCDVKSYMNF